MADKNKVNKNNQQPLEHTMEIDTDAQNMDAADEQTKAFAPTTGAASETADGQTKAFSAVGGNAENGNTQGETRQFTIDTGSKKPLEKCEERGSVKDYNAWSVSWRVLRPILILAVSAALVVFLGFRVYHYVEDSYFKPVDAQSEQMKKVEIKQGSSLSAIATTLYEHDIIRNKFVFQMYVDFNDMASSLLAGKYEFSPSMTMDEIVKILGKGDGGRKVVEVTFTEGMTAEDIADTLVKSGTFDAFQKIDFLKLCNDLNTFEEDYRFIQELAASESLAGRHYLLEGYLFPDTYQFYVDETPENIVRRMLTRFDEIFTLAFEDDAEDLGMTIDEVMTLASIIEWEGLPGDFKKVSAVFHNRLEIDMAFGSCATIRYVTGEKKLQYTSEELAIDDPYNTYMYAGLPLEPVTNPGQKAIDAALHPDEAFMEQGYLYFVNAAPDSGELVFAKTDDQHQENKAAYNEASGEEIYDTEDEG